MNKEIKLVPSLRFPEFVNEGEWVYLYGDKIFGPISNKDHNSDLPVLAITQEHGAIPRELINYTVIATSKSINSYKVVEIGDFIISLRSFQGGIEYSLYKGICSPAYIILRNKIKIENIFFKYYFKTDLYIRHLNKNLEGIRDGKMVSYKQFSEILLPNPSIPEQQKIASCLSLLDELIAAHKEKGLMKILFPQEGQVLPDLRFPEFQDSGMWKEIPFNKAFQRVTRKNIENNQNLLTISAQQGLVNQEEYFNKQIASKDVTNYYLIKKGEFAYNKSYSKDYPMGAIKVLKAYDKGVLSTLYICFKCQEGFNNKYFEHYFESGVFNVEIDKIAQEGARDHGLLNVSVVEFFKTLNVKVPPSKEEEEKVTSCLSSLNKLIITQGDKIERLQTHKKGLIQGLFPEIEN